MVMINYTDDTRRGTPSRAPAELLSNTWNELSKETHADKA